MRRPLGLTPSPAFPPTLTATATATPKGGHPYERLERVRMMQRLGGLVETYHSSNYLARRVCARGFSTLEPVEQGTVQVGEEGSQEPTHAEGASGRDARGRHALGGRRPRDPALSWGVGRPVAAPGLGGMGAIGCASKRRASSHRLVNTFPKMK